MGKLQITGETDIHVEDILNEPTEPTEPGERRERKEAATWLRDYLTNQGGSARSSDIKKAGEEAGFSKRTLERAAKGLVTSSAEGFPRVTTWSLP